MNTFVNAQISQQYDENMPDNWMRGAVPYFTQPRFTDGKHRNIYAAVEQDKANAVCVDVPAGQYLGDIDFKLPRYATIAANTGIGKSTTFVNRFERVCFVTSSVVALRQLQATHACDVFYSDEKTASAESTRIVTTYESLRQVIKLLNASQFWLVIDESHNIAASGSFRRFALDGVFDLVPGDWLGVTLLTGTPLESTHPAFSVFTRVNVASHVRTQRAQLIKHKPNTKRDALIARCDTDKRHLIYLKSKGKELSNIVAALEAHGFEPNEIHALNRYTRDEADGKRIVEREAIPDDAKVLIVTRLAIEAVNLRTQFDCVHIYSPLHPLLAQQLVNRQRGKAPGIAYIYTTGDGRAIKVDTEAWLRFYLNDAVHAVSQANALAGIDKRFDPTRIDNNARNERALHRILSNGKKQRMLRIVNKDNSAERIYDISYCGVDANAFEEVARQYNANPEAYKRMLAQYGWYWIPDAKDATEKAKKQSDAERDRCEELESAREDQFAKSVEEVRTLGRGQAIAKKLTGAADTRTLDAIKRVLQIHDTLLDGKAVEDDAERFTLACDFTNDAGANSKTHNQLVRRLRLQFARDSKHAFVSKLAAAFKVGERVTSDEIHARIVSVYQSDKIKKHEVEKVRVNYWSYETASRMTKTEATRLLNDLFETKRVKVKTDKANAERVNAYEIVKAVSLISYKNNDKESETPTQNDKERETPTHRALALFENASQQASVEESVPTSAPPADYDPLDDMLDILTGGNEHKSSSFFA